MTRRDPSNPALRKPRSIWLSDEEWAATYAAACADGKQIHDFIRTAIACQVECALEDPLPPSRLRDAPPSTMGRPRKEIDWKQVDAALAQSRGSIRGAASILGINYNTLGRHIARRRGSKARGRSEIVEAATRP